MTRKQRLTITVDAELVKAGKKAVAAGDADSLSAWVNASLAERIERDRLLANMAEAIAEYEAEHGAITEEEVAAQRRADRRDAVVVRGRKRGAAPPKRKARTV